MARLPALGVLVAIGFAASSVHAEPSLRRVLAAGGGLDALEVSVDANAGLVRVRRCETGDCSAPGGPTKELPISIDRSRIDLASSSIDAVPVGEGRQIAHVRIGDVQRKDLAFEALFSGMTATPIFAGLTGFTRGDEGDRSGQSVTLYDRDGESKFVIVAETREDTRICGQAATPLGPRGIDAKTMQLRGATLHRIDKTSRAAARRVIARRHEGQARPLVRVLVAAGGSAPSPSLLTDGKIETAWSEQRPGDGHGEFATLRSPGEVPLRSFVVTIAPSKRKAEGVAPRTFFVATDAALFHVTLPEDAWQKPEQAYEVPLPEPVRTTCVAFVLDEAYTRGLAGPEVTIAEVHATTKFDDDRASLSDVARALGSPRGDEAAALLKRGGDEAIAAVAEVYASLDAKGRALAIDVASSAGTCEGTTGTLLTKGLTDVEREVRKRALGRLERCGKSAGPALVIAVRDGDEAERAAAAPLLATVAPSLALLPLAEQMGKGTDVTRRSVRGAFARAATRSSREELLALYKSHAHRDAPLGARLDLLRATGSMVTELRPDVDAVVAELLRGSPDMPTRYLLVQPLAELARSAETTGGALSRLAQLARHDPAWPVRARAVELSAGIAPLAETLVAATEDPEARVREAALRGLAGSAVRGGSAAAGRTLARDPWPFVRVAAADVLAASPADADTAKALTRALRDESGRVRAAVIVALGRQRATSEAEHVRDRLDDAREDPDVRAVAAKTLAAMCMQNTANRLTELAQRSRAPVDEADDRIGIAAIEALGVLHPPDLEARLAPLRAKEVRLPVRRAAERALHEPQACR